VITTNVLYRTFFIKATQYGTAFAIDVADSQYLVTARHLLDESQPSIDLKIFFNRSWHSLSAAVIGHGRGDVDISVLQIDTRLASTEFKVNLTLAGAALGQDVYFLGFPYKMWGDVGSLMGGLPCAFAKKGTISSMEISESRQMLHIDAINNEGFSGGPLFIQPPGKGAVPQVIGIVSKFRLENEFVVDGDGNSTPLYVPYNTGFLVAYGIRYALEIIQRGPTRSLPQQPSAVV
jgi:hypothetical protein